MHLDDFSRRTNQIQALPSRPLSLPAFGDVWIGVLAGVISILQAGRANAPMADAAEPVLAEKRLNKQQMRELCDLGSSEQCLSRASSSRFALANRSAQHDMEEDPLAGAVEFSKIPEGESVLGRPIIIAKVRLCINVEENAVRINVEGAEFCSYESLIPLTGSEAERDEVGGVRIANPRLGTFRVDRGQLEILARMLLKARTGECTVTVPVTYRPETGLVSVEKKAKAVKHSVMQIFSTKPVSPAPDPSMSFKFERLSPPLAVTKSKSMKK